MSKEGAKSMTHAEAIAELIRRHGGKSNVALAYGTSCAAIHNIEKRGRLPFRYWKELGVAASDSPKGRIKKPHNSGSAWAEPTTQKIIVEQLTLSEAKRIYAELKKFFREVA